MSMQAQVPEQLVRQLREKKQLLEANNPQHKAIKTALVIDGGAMRGVFAAGAVAALKELGLENVFDMVIAVSAGTLSAAYFLGGEAEKAVKVFCEDLATRRFINFFTLRPEKVVGFDYVSEILLQKEPIRQEVIKKSRSIIYFGVTDPDTGKAVYLDVKKEKCNLVDAIFASSSMPLLHEKVPPVNHKKYLDGMIACGIPIAPALQYGCTDILIIENTPLGKPDLAHIPFLPFLFHIYRYEVSDAAKKAIFAKGERYQQTLKEIENAQKRGVTIGIIAPEKLRIGPFSIKKELLESVAKEGRDKTLQLFR